MKKIKNIFFLFIFSLVIASQGILSHASSLSKLKAGTYTISNSVTHESETGMAMARSYLKETMTLEKSDGNWYYTIKLTGLQYMSNHKVYVNGSKVSAVTNKNTSADTIELKFKTSSISPDLKVSMYVSAMGRDVEFGVIPKESTLKLVKAAQEVVETESNNKTDTSTTINNNSTSNSSNESTTNSSSNSSSTATTNSNTSTSTSQNTEETNENETEADVSSNSDNKDESEEDTKEEEVAEDENEDAQEIVETEEEISEASDEKISNKFIFIGIGAVIVVAILVLVLRKFKK